MASGLNKNARKRMFHEGQLLDITTVIRDAGELCVDLGILLGDGFGKCVEVGPLLIFCSDHESVELKWDGGKMLSVNTHRVCYILTVQDHGCCE